MMSNNKILTVSYGTFSCTLEGFEDSFETMKVIAEYFRDLAQDDRYFGAEPPKPDAEMLARIAEREVARRVEARTSDAGIHLRANDAPSEQPVAVPAAAVPMAAAPIALTDADAEAEAVQSAAAEGPQDAQARTEGQPSPIEAAEDTSVAVEPNASDDSLLASDETAAADEAAPETETLSASIAAVMGDDADTEDSAAAPETAAAETVVADDDSAADIAEEPMDVVDVPAESDDADIATAADTVPNTPEVAAAALEAEAVNEGPTPETVEEHAHVSEIAEVEPVAAPERETSQAAETSIAAKLQRIRDVVAKNKPETAAYDEDQHASDMMGNQPLVTDTGFDEEDVTPVEAPDEDHIADASEADTSSDEDLTAALVSRALGVDEAGDRADVFEMDDKDVDTSRPDGRDAEDHPADDLTTGSDDDVETMVEAIAAQVDAPPATEEADSLQTYENETDDDAEFDADDLAQIAAALEGHDDEQDIEVEHSSDDASEPRDAVIAVPRAELEEALEQADDIDEILDDSLYDGMEEAFEEDAVAELEGADTNETAAQSTLSDEDEAELLRDLAAVEAELPDDLDAPEPVDASTTSEEVVAEAQPFEQAGGFDESDLDRLMAEADNQMEEPEGSSRRDAFNHLRAAVAATKADDKLSEEVSGESDADEYRTDLAAAVKPRRPVAGGGRSARPTTHRPAPLKLVAEQRIDPQNAASGPVRPRRIAARSGDDGMAEGSGFADYATAQGATELPDLLEAAASYLSFVEGREQFSRPQLMTKVRQVGHEGFTREDGLRSFGKLLRAGKIEKIKGGRFTVSDDIGFRPDERAAG